MLRRTEQTTRSDASLILKRTFDMPQRDMNEFLKELADEGLVTISEKDGYTYFEATNGPSLYSVIQEKILEDLYKDGQIQ